MKKKVFFVKKLEFVAIGFCLGVLLAVSVFVAFTELSNAVYLNSCNAVACEQCVSSINEVDKVSVEPSQIPVPIPTSACSDCDGCATRICN